MNNRCATAYLLCLLIWTAHGHAADRLSSDAAGNSRSSANAPVDHDEQLRKIREALVQARSERSAGPKWRFITGATTDPDYRAYLATWDKRIKRASDAYFSENADYPAVGGSLMLAVSIDRKGQLVRAQIVKSSESTALDQAAIAIAKRANPFAPIPPVKEVDVLCITRTWEFVSSPPVDVAINSKLRAILQFTNEILGGERH